MIYLIIGVLIALIAVIFGLQNSSEITVHFLAWKLHGSTGLILLATFLLGILATFFTYLPKMIRNHSKIRRLQRQLNKWEHSSANPDFDVPRESGENDKESQ